MHVNICTLQVFLYDINMDANNFKYKEIYEFFFKNQNSDGLSGNPF